MSFTDWIEVTGSRVNNLRNVSVRIPRGSLTVITGLSGSGKSSLAFDTIFAEGQRRYIDTFSSYARGFMQNMQRPDVDKITGLSPVISIDQKTTSRNPRSTVGTVTEVYDYLRLLFARAGRAYSYETGEEMVHYTDDQILKLITERYEGKKVLILAPVVKNRKGHYRELFDQIRRKGFVYVRVDGEIREITFSMRLDRYKNHSIEVVVDRLKIQVGAAALSREDNDLKRISQSINQAMQMGEGQMMVESEGEVRYFSRTLMCPTTGISYDDPAPHHFSFNSPQGWCPCCRGLGRIKISQPADDELPEEDEVLQWLQGGDATWAKKNEDNDDNGSEELQWVECPECHGARLRKESLMFRIGEKNIAELSAMDISQLRLYLDTLTGLTERQQAVATEIIKEISSRLGFMEQVGLTYLSLSRPSDSLSGGESQRIRLATQIGSRLVNVLYILDEPSIGLHQRDNERLITSLKELRDMGNTVIVVEHDEQIMREADWLVDIGPGAGRLGGNIVFEGTYADMLRSHTLTAEYLTGTRIVPPSVSRPIDDKQQWLVVEGARGNNLNSVKAAFPLGKLICVTGVSGSGKSTLVNKTLYPALSQRLTRSLTPPMAYDNIYVMSSKEKVLLADQLFKKRIDKIVAVDQSPIGRTPRSNPATYTGVFSDIRELFAMLPESKIRNWKAGRFSFNTGDGRCKECSGNGYKTIEMRFLPDVYVQCEACNGMRYNKETLEARFKGKNIGEVLNMTINQAVEFFEAQPHILQKIKTLQQVGLGYLKLGQSSTTLSGGEAQRMKLASELARPTTGKTLYILDEPTTGLHFDDIRVLLDVLQRLVDKGNTVIIIEHNLDVIRAADYIIDLGPEGGRGGGTIVADGPLSKVRRSRKSFTAKYL
ncbi:MAG: excinuclease ABC subunit UvrA [Paludibacteraceae bacterium]|nr:excinuclease ABC subunit UvrA [Paludibacteraceae bacterium]